MKVITLEVDKVSHSAEILSAERLDNHRSIIKVHCTAKLDRGRCCVIRTEDGQELDCVISNFAVVKEVYLIELRCLADAQFLVERPGSSMA